MKNPNPDAYPDDSLIPNDFDSFCEGMVVLDDYIQDCDEIIAWTDERGEWKRSIIGTEGDRREDEIRTSFSMGFPFMHYDLPPALLNMNRAVWEAIKEYGRVWNCPFSLVEDPSVQRYEPGQEYGVHIDFIGDMPRVISAVAYLNDDFTGGQTHFPKMGATVYPRKGRLVLFPSNFMFAHAALPPKDGTKYAAAYWVRG